ncbi:MAG: class I SAM-dependent methyltransferase [Mariprofundaceae bacterium]
MRKLLDLLCDPSIENINVDGKDRLEAHRKILANKPMLREVFKEFHRTFYSLDEEYFSSSGKRIELGAGIAPVRDSYPDVLATDVVYDHHLDQVLDAENIDLPDQSVRAIYGQNCFHHFPHPERFFKELERVLTPGGGVILIEPYYGSVASFLYKRLFKTEGFDKDFPAWEVPSSGPMNGANQALSYIVFNRDRKVFEEKFLELEIVYSKPLLNYLRYLLSGGLNFRALIPDFMEKPMKLLEFILSPLCRLFALHYVIVIKRKNNVV